MGLHISIYRADGSDHPSWDCGRYAGDREFAAGIPGLPHVRKSDDVYSYDIDSYRPADFDAWRVLAREVNKDSNEGRLEQAVDILEREPDSWMHFGW